MTVKQSGRLNFIGPFQNIVPDPEIQNLYIRKGLENLKHLLAMTKAK
jgi:hypothetical protein